MARRVFIVWSHPLFNETVRRLLDQSEVEVVGTESQRAAARAEIDILQPDTIIVEEDPDQAADYSEALKLVESSPWEPRVIRLSLQDNELWVYQREKWTIRTSGDLIDHIQDRD